MEFAAGDSRLAVQLCASSRSLALCAQAGCTGAGVLICEGQTIGPSSQLFASVSSCICVFICVRVSPAVRLYL